MGIESSCWGRKSSGEEGRGKGKMEGKGKKGRDREEEIREGKGNERK